MGFVPLNCTTPLRQELIHADYFYGRLEYNVRLRNSIVQSEMTKNLSFIATAIIFFIMNEVQNYCKTEIFLPFMFFSFQYDMLSIQISKKYYELLITNAFLGRTFATYKEKI